jgi:transcription elongation factor Elf1
MECSEPKPPYLSECLRCGETMLLSERSVHLDRHPMRRLWKCESCDYEFETRVAFRDP